jgi:hypothetical protein
MQKVDKLVGFAYFSLILIGVPCLAWWDFHHPEKWEREPANNPRYYLPLMALLWCFLLYFLLVIASTERRIRKRARFNALLIRAEQLVKQKRRDEASAVLKECQALYGELKANRGWLNWFAVQRKG